MDENISWEIPPKETKPNAEIYIAIIILFGALGFASYVLDNFLLIFILVISLLVLLLVLHKDNEKQIIALSKKGILVDNLLYEYNLLESFTVREKDDVHTLLVQSKKFFSPLIVLPVPEHLVDDVLEILSKNLDEAELHIPLTHIIAEKLGL